MNKASWEAIKSLFIKEFLYVLQCFNVGKTIAGSVLYSYNILCRAKGNGLMLKEISIDCKTETLGIID